MQHPSGRTLRDRPATGVLVYGHRRRPRPIPQVSSSGVCASGWTKNANLVRHVTVTLGTANNEVVFATSRNAAMNIAAVLSRRGRQFDCVPDKACLSDAIFMMNNKSIGSVGVMAAGDPLPVGIISQSELVTSLARHGADALAMPVTRFMRKPVPSCRCADQVHRVLHLMTMARSRHSIVLTEGGAMAGLVSLGDLVAVQLEESRMEADVLRDLARSHLLATPAA